MPQLRLSGTSYHSGRQADMEYNLHIGHSGDALNLLDQILEQASLDQETREALEFLRDAIDRVLF